jgi:hypothetical protein
VTEDSQCPEKNRLDKQILFFSIDNKRQRDKRSLFEQFVLPSLEFKEMF